MSWRSWRSWRFPGIHPSARLARSVCAALLAFPLALLALAPLAGPVAAHPAHAAAPNIGKIAPADVDLTLHYHSTLSGLSSPGAVATDTAGNLYVSDSGPSGNGPDAVLMYNTSDAQVRSYSASGLIVGFVAVGGGTVYVVDNPDGEIWAFNQSTGAVTGKFGSGILTQPAGVALGSNGTLYVVDQGNDRIAEFNSGGTFLGSFGTGGYGNGQFNSPVGIAFNPTNSDLYVTDNASRVEVFTLAGTYVSQWGGSFNLANGIAVDRAGMVYVASTGNQTIYKFDPSGSEVGYYAAPTTTPYVPGTFSLPISVAVRSAANQPLAVYVADYGIGNGIVERFDQVLDPQVHTYQSQWGSFGTGNGQFSNPGAVVVDNAGNVYVADSANNRIEKFDQFGTFLSAFGSFGTGNGQFDYPNGLALSPDGKTLYVSDTDNNRIQIFDISGASPTYVSQFGSKGSGTGQFSSPYAIATDGTHLYVTDSYNDRIEVFDTSGTYQYAFGTKGSAANQFNGPVGIAVDSARQELFIADYTNNRVEAYTIGGTLITTLTSAAGANFNGPSLVSTDQRGDVYVADYTNNRIVEFDVNLTRTTAFGTGGTGNGQLNGPFDMAVSPTNGQIYVVDSGNNRIERFGSPWPKNDTVGVYRPSTKTFYLRNENTTGPADIIVPMPYAQSGDLPIVGDWNGDGVDTVGLYRPSTARFLLQDANVQESAPDYTFTLGVSGDTPIAGDWNGQGTDGAGIFRPSNGILYLKNTLSTGVADDNLVLGKPGDVGIAGDWNGDGQDSPGVYRPSNERFYVTNKVTDGVVYSDASAVLGISGDAPFTGDWVAQGFSGIGVFRPTNGVTYENNTIVTGAADNHFIYGVAGDMPVAGQWVEPSVPFTTPAPHVSLGTRGPAPHPTSGGSGKPAPARTAASGQTPATTPRRSTPR